MMEIKRFIGIGRHDLAYLAFVDYLVAKQLTIQETSRTVYDEMNQHIAYMFVGYLERAGHFDSFEALEKISRYPAAEVLQML